LYTNFLPFPKKEEVVLHPERREPDVIVLCIYFDKQMTNTSELWLQMGNVSSVKDGRRFLPIHELCSFLSEITCRVLPGAHALFSLGVTAEVVLPDRKHAKLWSGMRHEEYADEAPLLKVVI
jgi:hypothetical protein